MHSNNYLSERLPNIVLITLAILSLYFMFSGLFIHTSITVGAWAGFHLARSLPYTAVLQRVLAALFATLLGVLCAGHVLSTFYIASSFIVSLCLGYLHRRHFTAKNLNSKEEK